MDNNLVYEKINESLDMIFSFALKRTSNRYEAEDLSQEIIMNLYSSACRLKDINKFYGWMWAVARNVFKSYLRKKSKKSNIKLSETHTSVSYLPEKDFIENEQIKLVYRELSILSGLYRETMCLYYLHNKSCDEIAEQLGISNNMVKQYLFKSRKKVKEGLDMIRESGERSFNPRKFNIYSWGEKGNYCYEIFKRKLPGNIMLEAYYEPITIEELSLELGVATVYLEEEIEILRKNGLLKQMRNSKVQSNILIFTEDFESELYSKTSQLYSDIASYLHNYINEKEPKIRSLEFHSSDMCKNTLLWQMVTICLLEGMITKFLNDVMTKIATEGSREYMWGLERVYGDNNFDLGMFLYKDREMNELRGIDYYIVEKKVQILCNKITGDVILRVANGDINNLSLLEEEELARLIQNGDISSIKGSLSVNLPVYTADQFSRLKEILKPAIEKIYLDCKSTLPVTEKILKNYTPNFLHNQLPIIASLKQVEAFIINTMNNMFLQRFIEIPKPCNELLTAFIVLVK